MRTLKSASFLLLGFVVSCSAVLAGSNSLKGRSAIDLNIGLWHESKVGNEISVAGITSTARTNGFSGGLSFGYWIEENLSVGLSVGVLSGEATSSITRLGSSQRSSTVIPILLGIKYYILESSVGSPVKPFLSIGVGSYLGFEAKNELFSQQAHTETVVGTRLGGGVDFLLGHLFKLGANAGYNLMTDFSTPVGARTNYNGPDFSLSFGIMFGEGEGERD
jgi:outer membrane protein W